MNNLGIIHVSSQNIPRIIQGLTFSAAMNSSRSDIVTQFVRSSVTKEFFNAKRGKEVTMVFQGSFNGVSRKFHRCFKKVSRTFQKRFKVVSRKFQGCLKKVSRTFQKSFKGVSRKFQGCLKEVSRVLQGTFKGVSIKFQWHFNEFTSMFF